LNNILHSAAMRISAEKYCHLKIKIGMWYFRKNDFAEI